LTKSNNGTIIEVAVEFPMIEEEKGIALPGSFPAKSPHSEEVM
jgi:hypothetical protein